MLGTVKDKVKDSIQNKAYDKENKGTILEFRDTIIEDIESTLNDANAVKATTEKLLENKEDIHSDEFILDKVDSELEYLGYCLKKLEQMNKKAPKKFRLLDIYGAYKRIIKTGRSVRNIKEYVHRIKEDRLMYELNKNSQCN